MADIGAKVSRVDVGVGDAADSQLLFSSAWPTLKIAYQGAATISGTADSVILTHNLGYPPAFLVYYVSGTTSTFKSYGFLYNGSAGGYVGVNSTEMKFFTIGGGAGNVSLYYYIFAQPLNEDFDATTISTIPSSPSITEGPLDYGVKVALDGKSVTSTDFRDYAFRSDAISPNVHIIGHGAPTETGITQPLAKMYRVVHGLGYEPLPLFYIDYGANGGSPFVTGYYYSIGGVGGASYIRAYSDATNCRIEEDYDLLGAPSPTANCSIIVLKEPFNTVDGYSITSSY